MCEGRLSGSLQWRSMATWSYLSFEFEFEFWVHALGFLELGLVWNCELRVFVNLGSCIFSLLVGLRLILKFLTLGFVD